MSYKIYLIENTINTKKYVGYTSQTLRKRFYQHSISDKPIGKAIRKHGKSCFKVTLIEEHETIESVLENEKKWILHHKAFGCGYNCTVGGDRSPVKRNSDSYKTEEFRRKVRKNAIEQHSDSVKKKNHVDGIRNYWKNLTEEQMDARRKIAVFNGKKSTTAWNKGRKFPGTGKAGEKNPMAKQYRVWFPDGTETVIQCLSLFCKNNGLT